VNQQIRQLQEHGRCISEGSHELFFSDKPAELAKAQLICASCDVRVRCLDVALQDGHEWGVWGGVIFWDGQPFHRRRSRGRPPVGDTNLPIEANRSELLELVRSA
jgi:WhiB family redox-sensing transcriptional regulator